MSFVRNFRQGSTSSYRCANTLLLAATNNLNIDRRNDPLDGEMKEKEKERRENESGVVERVYITQW